MPQEPELLLDLILSMLGDHELQHLRSTVKVARRLSRDAEEQKRLASLQVLCDLEHERRRDAD